MVKKSQGRKVGKRLIDLTNGQLYGIIIINKNKGEENEDY